MTRPIWAGFGAMVALACGGERASPPVASHPPSEVWVRHGGAALAVRVPVGWSHSEEADSSLWEALVSAPDGSCEGRAVVRPATPGDPVQTATHGLAELCVQSGCLIHQAEPVLYNQKSSWRWEVRLSDSGRMMRHTSSVRVDPDGGRWLISLEVVGGSEEYVAQRRCLDRVTAAVSIGPGGDAGRHGRADTPQLSSQLSPR